MVTSEATTETTKSVEETTAAIAASTETATPCPVCTEGFNGTLWDCGCYLIVLDHNTTKKRNVRSGSALPWQEADLNCIDIGDDSHLLGELF